MTYTEEQHKDYEALQAVAVCFGDLSNHIENMELEELKSFKEAKSIFFTALSPKGKNNFSLKAQILKAFEHCYVDIEAYEKAVEMKQKCAQLCEEHNLDLPS